MLKAHSHCEDTKGSQNPQVRQYSTQGVYPSDIGFQLIIHLYSHSMDENRTSKLKENHKRKLFMKAVRMGTPVRKENLDKSTADWSTVSVRLMLRNKDIPNIII